MNPSKKLLNWLAGKATRTDLDDIEFYTGKKFNEVIQQGSEISELTHRCLDENDELEFDDVFLNDTKDAKNPNY